jgi:hypothetical protein
MYDTIFKIELAAIALCFIVIVRLSYLIYKQNKNK